MHQYLKFLLLGLVLTSAQQSHAQNRVVVVPMLDEKTIFTGVGQTGNDRCSSNIGTEGNAWEEVPCDSLLVTSLAGQDAQIQAGAIQSPRFTDNGDGTITDNLSGLVWLQNANCALQAATWAEALAFIEELNSFGTMAANVCGDASNSNDWRLPNVKELQSLQFFGVDEEGPFLSNSAGNAVFTEGDPFVNLQVGNPSAYWSSTSYGYVYDDDPLVENNLIDNALRVNLKDAVTDGTSKDGDENVWAVRSGL